MGAPHANTPGALVPSRKIQAVKLVTEALGNVFPANQKTSTDAIFALVNIIHNLGLAREFSIKSAFTDGKISWQSLRSAERGRKEERRKTSPTPPQRQRQHLKGSQCRGFQKGTPGGRWSTETELQQQRPKGGQSSLCLRESGRWAFVYKPSSPLERKPNINLWCLKHSNIDYMKCLFPDQTMRTSGLIYFYFKL